MGQRPLVWGLVWGVMLALFLVSLVGCESTPPADQRPQVVILRQFFFVPVAPDTEQSCGEVDGCWYEEPEIDGPI